MESTGAKPSTAVSPKLSGATQATADIRWIDLILVLFISFSGYVLIAIYALFNPGYFSTPTQRPALSIASLLLHHSTAFLVLAYVLVRQNRNLRSLGIGFRWIDPLLAIGLCLLASVAVMLIHGMEGRVSAMYGIPLDTRNVAQPGWKDRSVSELIHSISSPIFEEVLVRGYLMTEMLELGQPAIAAVFVSVVLQASYHLYYGLSTAVSLSGVFIVFAIYFAFSRKLMPVILAHLFWDVFLYLKH
jgi:membrane protease YdiL (CAAX protease family)